MKKKPAGFTLIEIMVVVAVLSILSGIVLGVVNPGGLRSKTRDSQRVQDLKRIQATLELYYSNKHAYPVSAAWSVAAIVLNTPLSTGNYMKPIPVDPSITGSGNFCNGDRNYYYLSVDGSKYSLSSIMEVGSSATGVACNSSGCASAPARCYTVGDTVSAPSCGQHSTGIFPACTCESLYGNCDSDPTNGCEADLRFNVMSCGSCTTVCPRSYRCTAGVCLP